MRASASAAPLCGRYGKNLRWWWRSIERDIDSGDFLDRRDYDLDVEAQIEDKSYDDRVQDE
jgi:hypothetical protein